MMQRMKIMTKKRFQWETRGKALPENLVCGEKYRFTVLTSRLIRMEYDESGIFEDRATQSFFYRDTAQVAFSAVTEGQNLRVETEHLTLTYRKNAQFTPQTLSVQMNQAPVALWHYGDKVNQLKGTARTLDEANGPIPLEDGVISRNGYAVVDDSTRMVLTEEGWFDIRKEGIQDLYFFGYGHAYLDCLKDFYQVTGAPPMLPDYALGNWWSRYHAYTQQEYCQLIERFEKEKLPFSVAVVDMDWHKEGWTGYTWNKDLFPDYKGFLRFLREHHLKSALNLHPADGVGSHEAMYEEMAKACGVDPETKKTVKLDCLDPEFMEHYFDIVHHPYEEAGVDFWWMDWQQGTDYWWVHDEDHPASPLERMDPLWLLNHLHVLDISRNGKRPMFFSRYCGIGAHRYPIGFSGDTIVTWESLKFQPYFTATASNIGYSWWSHDIGGHMCGYRDDELMVRWIQLGVFSPINRLHSTKDCFSGKEPWNLFPYEAQIAGDWLRLRHRLFPYLYTMNHRSHTQGIPLVLPMYYTAPEKDAAYSCPNEYWFGSELIVSPITEKNDPCIRMGRAKVWFPEGLWIDAFNGYVYRSEREIDVYRSLSQMPVFAKAGAIVPMQPCDGDNRLGKKASMELMVFAGADNSFTLYEDAGDTNAYQQGAWVRTSIDLEWKKEARLTIHAAQGDLSLIPPVRSWKVLLRGVKKPAAVTAAGEAVEFVYDPDRATASVTLAKIPTTSEITITFTADLPLLYDNRGAKQRVMEMLTHAQMAYNTKTAIWEQAQKSLDKLFAVCTEPTHKGILGVIEEMRILESCR